ncbi:MAG: hypothetical protein ABFD16_18890 [Thermoguttaceae bacterium]|jgi:hypothetical protein
MESILAEIRQSQSLDPRTEEELVRNLRATPPNLWPLVVQQFRAALAYRRQAQERERGGPPSQLASGIEPARPQPIEDQAAAYHRPEPRDVPPPAAPLPPREPTAPLPSRDDRKVASLVVPLPDPRAVVSLPAPRASEEPARDRATPLPTPAKVVSLPATEATQPERPKDAPSEPRVTGDWRSSLNDTIRQLETRVQASPQSPEEIADQARLRMLYLADGRRDDAMRPIPTIPNSMQDFWSKEFCGLAVMLDPQRSPEPSRRAGEAQQHLSEAVMRLRETAPLLVRNLAFVTDVQSYGAFKPFDKYAFRPGQRVLLYAEVENFKIKESNRGYHTALQSSYQIIDNRGQRVTDHDFGTNEEHCQNPRRDFYIGYDFVMPKQIPPGKYVLQLTVTDLNGDKIGQSSLDFTIVGGEEVARRK